MNHSPVILACLCLLAASSCKKNDNGPVGPKDDLLAQQMLPTGGGAFAVGSVTVTLTKYDIDMYEVTYENWTEVRDWGWSHGYTDIAEGRQGSAAAGRNHPVTQVNWYDIIKWCNARSEKDGLTPVYYTSGSQATVYKKGEIDLEPGAVKWLAYGYRLPTEAEWEFAASGGVLSTGRRYSGSDTCGEAGWYSSNSGGGTHPAAQKDPNELGLYDMSGNVWEWCWDWASADYPTGGTSEFPNWIHDPKGPAGGQTQRVLRGGSYASGESVCRIDRSASNLPSTHTAAIGFRCARTSFIH